MEELIYKAKLAEQAELFEDMVVIMKEVVHHSSEMTEDQRNLFSSAYKNVVGGKRAAWRLIFDIENKELSRKKLVQAELAQGLRDILEEELNAICMEVIDLIDEILTTKANGHEGRVFFNKMKGDYYRYMSEFQTSGPNITKYGFTMRDNAEKYYLEGLKIADSPLTNNQGLPSFHCVRLGLSLNYAVFYYEVKKDYTRSREIASKAFNTALNDIEKIDDVQYKNSLEIMQLIKDNLNMWNSEAKEPIKESIPVEDENA
jgi:14-3-3 protein epsilon